MALAVASTAMAYSFSQTAPSGQTLYYTITSTSEVKVVPPVAVGWIGYSAPTGRLTIPATVQNGGTTYSVTAIDRMAFNECYELTAVTIPGSVVSIAMQAFANDTVLTSVTMGEGVQRIDMMAFARCSSLDTIVLPSTITRIAISAFDNTGFVNNEANWQGPMLILGQWVIKVGNLVEGTVTIPHGIVGLANSSLLYCRYMDKIVLPSTLRYVGEGAFKDCYELDTVRMRSSNPPAVSDDSFDGVSPLPILVVPLGTSSIYAAAEVWCDFTIVEDSYVRPDPPIPPFGIDDVQAPSLVVSVVEGGVVVIGAEGLDLTVCDAAGRQVAAVTNAMHTQYLPLSATGVYVVIPSVGPSHKISYSK